MISMKSNYQKVLDDNNPHPVQTSDYVDDVLNRIGFGMFQIAAFCFIGMTYIAFIGEVLTFAFISIPVMKEWDLSPLMFSSVSASTFVGNIIGQSFLSYIADKYGRFWPYFISLLVIACLVLGSAFAPSFYIFLALRMLASAGIGGVIVLSYPVLMEFLPVKMRGKVAILTNVINAFSSCGTAGLAWYLIPNYNNGWRYFIACTSIPAFLAVLFRLLFFIESPRYLVSKGEMEKAWKTFSIMATMNFKRLDDLISKEEFMKGCSLSLTPITLANSKPTESALQQLLTILKPPLLRQTFCLTLVYSFQIMVAYGTTLFLPYNLKILGIDPYVCSFIAFVAEIPGVLFFTIIVDWPEFGRKNTIRIASFISVILYFLFAFVQNEVSIPVLTVLIYFLLLPLVSVIMTYAAESYPTEIRVMALAFIANVTCILSIGLTFGAGYLAEQSHKYSWLSPTVWASMLVIQLIAALFLTQETRGRNLQDYVHEVN